MKRIAAGLVLAIAAISSASALELAGEMYVVGSVGRAGVNQTEVQVNNNNIMWGSRAPVQGFETMFVNTLQGLRSAQTSSRNGYKLQLGYEFSPNFAVEGGYTDLGKTEYTATYSTQWAGVSSPSTPGGTPQTGYSVVKNAEISGWNVAGVGIYPLNASFSVFAKLGMLYARVKQTVSGKGPFSTSVENDDSNAKGYYGFGATYYPFKDKNFGVRAEFEKYLKVGDNSITGVPDVSLATVGISTKF